METDHDNVSLRVDSFSCYLDAAKENLVHRISAQENPIFLSSSEKAKSPTTKPPYNNFSYSKETKDNLINLRSDSFSYLSSPTGDNFVFNVPGSVRDPTPAFSFPKATPKDGEISIFGADKYFNMKLEYPTREKLHEHREEKHVNLARVGSNGNRPTRTPSLSSEASSWNSQAALLRRNGSQTRPKKTFGRRIFSGFQCHGPCFHKKGVHVNELVVPGAYYSPNPSRTSLKTSPNHGAETFNNAKKHMEVAKNVEESRDSMEVFGSNTTSLKGNVATNMERKLSILTWDAIPKGQNLPTSIASSTICDDMASDASSDLFEIENISGSMYPISTPEADDVSICMSPTSSHYAPSEASIQWSVVTASAVDNFSDYYEGSSVSVAGDKMSRDDEKKKRNGGGKEGQKGGRAGGLLGCKSHKAVDVAENVVSNKANEKPKHQGLDLSVKSQGSRVRVKDIDTLELQRSFDSGGFLL